MCGHRYGPLQTSLLCPVWQDLTISEISLQSMSEEGSGLKFFPWGRTCCFCSKPLVPSKILSVISKFHAEHHVARSHEAR